MQVELYEDRGDLPLDGPTWNGLLTRSDVNTVFQTYEWFEAWWRAIGHAHQLFFVIVKDADGIVGFAPLAIMQNGSRRELQFAGAAHADYLDFIIVRRHEEALGAIARLLRMHRKRWDRIYLRNLPMHAPGFARLLPVFEAAGLYPLIETTIGCPTLLLRGHEEEVRTLLDKYSLRRRVSGLQKMGKLEFHAECAAEDLGRYLPMFFDQHVARWSGTSSPSLFGDDTNRALYVELAHAWMRRGWLAFSRLELDGQPIAFHYGIRYERRLIWYKPSFDPRFAQASPGLALIRYLIQYAVDEGMVELDFTIGDEQFKERFTNLRRANANVLMFPGAGTYCAAVMSKHLRRVARRGLNFLDVPHHRGVGRPHRGG